MSEAQSPTKTPGPKANPENKQLPIANDDENEAKEVVLPDPNEVIKTYRLRQGSYRMLVHIIEAEDLNPPKRELNLVEKMINPDTETFATPYVIVEVLDQKKKTKVKAKTMSPRFNEKFTFEFENLLVPQLEEASLIFTVMNYGALKDTFIGTFEVDLTTVYFSLNHELYEVTLQLYDPDNEAEGTCGMLKVTIEVLGPKDKPNVHNVISDVKPGTVQDKVLRPAWIKAQKRTIEVFLYRAEYLPPLDPLSDSVDAYCMVKYGGASRQTKQISSYSPEWNQKIKLTCPVPNQSKAVNFEVWDNDPGVDDLIGTFKVNVKEFEQEGIQPRWANLYGPPLSATVKDEKKAMEWFGYDIGSHFRGRVLYAIGYCDEEDHAGHKELLANMPFSFPKHPPPSSAQRSYRLHIDIYEAHELPQRDRCIITVAMGPYLLKTTAKEIMNGRCCIYQQLEEKKVLFPAEPEEIPDIIFYFSDAEMESRRHCFARLKASDFLDPTESKLTTIKLKEDQSLNLVEDEEFPGLLYAEVSLWTIQPPPRPQLSNSTIEMKDYQLSVMIYVARDLPPADKEGTSDPYVVVRSAGEKKTTEVKYSTLNPGWYETLKLKVQLPAKFETSKIPEGISLIVYDADSHDDKESNKELLGRAWMEFGRKKTHYIDKKGNSFEIFYQKPRWKRIKYDATGESQGKILVSYALIDWDMKDKIQFDEDITPESTPHTLHIFFIGITDLNMDEFGFWKPKALKVSFSVSGDQSKPKETGRLVIKNNGVSVGRHESVEIHVPNTEALPPLLDVHLHGWTATSGESQVLGYTAIDLKNVLAYFYEQNARRHKILEEEVAATMIGEDEKEEGVQEKRPLLEKDNEKARVRDLEMIKPGVHGDHVDLSTFRIKGDVSKFSESIPSKRDLEAADVVHEMNVPSKKGAGVTDNQTSLKKKGLFPNFFSIFSKQQIIYEDYDTDSDEEYDITPAWMKDRGEEKRELEEVIKGADEIQTFDLKHGRSRGKAKLFEPQPKNELTAIATMKVIFLEGKEEDIETKCQRYEELLQPKRYVCRIYILEGEDVTIPSNQGEPDSYLVIKLGDETKKEIDKTLRKNNKRPKFYTRYDFVTDLPGSGKLTVELWHRNLVLRDEFLGSTKIDLEARHFNTDWNKYEKKPIEHRALMREDGRMSNGSVSLWVDIHPTEGYPPYEIAPIQEVDCELRVIVWEAKEFDFDDELTQSNDLYIRASLNDTDWLETDTHWRARSKATYNWRLKFDMKLLPNDDKRIKVQLWDRDIITKNSMIGEATIDLNQHNMLNKVYKNRKSAKIMKRYKVKNQFGILEVDKTLRDKVFRNLRKNKEGQAQEQPQKKPTKGATGQFEYVETDRIWFDAYHPTKTNADGNKRSVGKVLLSFELMTKEEAEKNKNAMGRDQPNKFPALADPVGRFTFDVFSPLETIKGLIGPDLYRKFCLGFCCVFLLVFIFAFGYFIFTTFIGAKIAQ